MRINGSIAVVTGASGGIGRAVAVALAKADGTVALVGCRRPQLEEVELELAELGRRALVVCDVTAIHRPYAHGLIANISIGIVIP